jgi:hypothetical protein
LKVLDRFTLLDRIIAFSADNNNCNFGGAKWRRKNNVFLENYEILRREV